MSNVAVLGWGSEEGNVASVGYGEPEGPPPPIPEVVVSQFQQGGGGRGELVHLPRVEWYDEEETGTEEFATETGEEPDAEEPPQSSMDAIRLKNRLMDELDRMVKRGDALKRTEMVEAQRLLLRAGRRLIRESQRATDTAKEISEGPRVKRRRGRKRGGYPRLL